MDLRRFTVSLNPVDDQGRTIYRYGERAYVAIPFGSRTPPGVPRPMPPSGAGSEFLNVEMPESMNDPAFAACAGGVIRTTEDGTECVCLHPHGNPPPPPHVVPCPDCARTMARR